MIRRLGFILMLSVLSLSAVSCAKKEEDAEPVLETYSIPAEVDAEAFKGNDESVYWLQRGEGEKHDITPYVYSCIGTDARFTAPILKDVFGYEATATTQGEASDRIIDYTNIEGDTLQLYVGKNIAFHNGEKVVLNGSIEYIDEAGTILPFDIFHALGYNRVDIERDNNELTFIVKKE